MPGIMETAALSAANRRPRTRQSISHISDLAGNDSEDKENATVDLSSLLSLQQTARTSTKVGKKSRSKSMGPGGLEALKETSGNRRKAGRSLFMKGEPKADQNESTVAFVPKSILKPTLPISPLKPTPLKGFGRANNQTRPTALRAQSAPEGALIELNEDSADKTSTNITIDLFNLSQKISEVTQHDAAVKATEEARQQREERERLEKEIKERREARRKSLANRRVSFAPEATLHTWDIREMPQDSTTSSASTNSTRRDSAVTNPTIAAPYPPRADDTQQHSDATDPPSTPPGPPEDEESSFPAHQRDLHQRKNRTSINGLALLFPDQLDDDLGDSEMSSPLSGSSAFGDDEHTANTIANTGSRSPRQTLIDGILGDIMGGDDEKEDTIVSSASDSSARLQSALREAAQESVNSERAEDDSVNGDATMELTQENMVMFKPWVKAKEHNAEPTEGVTMFAAGPPLNHQIDIPVDPSLLDHTNQSQLSTPGSKFGADEDMSFTQALGFIATNGPASKEASPSPAKSRKSLLGRRRSLRHSVAPSAFGDETMDLTSASFGGIRADSPDKSEKGNDETDGMTMDLTMANVGGIVQPAPTSLLDEQENETQMDMTVAVGGIKHPQSAVHTEPEPEQTMELDMDVTQPIGKILQPTPGNDSKPSTPQQQIKALAPQLSASRRQFASPSRLFTRKSPNGALTPRVVLTPKSLTRRRSSGIGADRDGLGSPQVAAILDRRTSIGQDGPAFQIGQSPRGKSGGVRFDDPKLMEAEVDDDRRVQQRRESGLLALEAEADGKMDGGMMGNLKEMISAMSPKKNKLKGRKSLAVGAAKGLLGKRPAELDSDEDNEQDEDDSFAETSRRLKMDQSSPVKQIRVGKPPTAVQTLGNRKGKGKSPAKKLRLSFMAPSQIAPEKTVTPSITEEMPATKSTPHAEKFKDVVPAEVSHMPSLDLSEVAKPSTNAEEDVENAPAPKIHLQDFLNQTSIRFLDLSTTRRRPTEPTITRSPLSPSSAANTVPTLSALVRTGATTLPLLELFQHSCRELRKYIAEGRGIVHQIEEEVLQDPQPPLFEEYLTAPPDVRFIMDRQFENVKHWAGMGSKLGWYEWRLKLLGSLKDGLGRVKEGMLEDERELGKTEAILRPALTPRVTEVERLMSERDELRGRADEIAKDDVDELNDARQRLRDLRDRVALKRQKIAQLQSRQEEARVKIATAKETKVQWTKDIAEANRVRQECRSYSRLEISQLRDRVERLHKQHGWQVLPADAASTASGAASWVALLYKSELQLTLDAADLGSTRAALFDDALTATGGYAAREVKAFLLSTIQTQLVDCASATPKSILTTASEIWDQLPALLQLGSGANLRFRTGVTSTSFTQSPIIASSSHQSPSLEISSALLLQTLESKLRVTLAVTPDFEGAAMRFKWKGSGRVIYGERFKEEVVGKFLDSRLGEFLDCGPRKGQVVWSEVLGELEEKLVASRPNGRTT